MNSNSISANGHSNFSNGRPVLPAYWKMRSAVGNYMLTLNSVRMMERYDMASMDAEEKQVSVTFAALQPFLQNRQCVEHRQTPTIQQPENGITCIRFDRQYHPHIHHVVTPCCLQHDQQTG